MMQTLRSRPSDPLALRIRRRLCSAIGLALAATMTGCAGLAGFKQPTLEVAEVRIASFDRETAQLTLLLKVDNPNANTLTLTDMKADLFLADVSIAEAVSAQPRVTLPAKTTVMVPMKISLTFKNLPKALQQSLLALVSGGLPYRLVGSVTTQNGLTVLPFERSGEILGMR